MRYDNLTPVQDFALMMAADLLDRSFPGSKLVYDDDRREWQIIIPDAGHDYFGAPKPLRLVDAA